MNISAKVELTFAIALALCLSVSSQSLADELPIVAKEDFESGADKWDAKDAAGWKIEKDGDNAIYSQFEKKSAYKPPHRSPFHVALLKDVTVGSFVLTAKVKSTHPDYGHRDACLFFGWQDPAHFYYVHLGKKTDDHANQIFIVNDAPRTKISTQTTPGTDWDDNWHNVKIVRDAQNGSIEIYYDDMTTPIMKASDKTFAWGQIGLGSFDDTSAWDDIELRGKLVKKEN